MVDGKKHVVAPRRLPTLRFRDGRLGQRQNPFAWLWAAVSDGSMPGSPAQRAGGLPRVVWQHWQANVGLRMVAEDVGRGIAERRKDDPLYEGRPILHVADPAMFTADGGPSIAERMALAKQISIRRADNARVSQRGNHGRVGPGARRASGRGSPDALRILHMHAPDPHAAGVAHDPDRPGMWTRMGRDHACFAAGTVIDGLGRVEAWGI